MDVRLLEVSLENDVPIIKAIWKAEPLTIGFDTGALFALSRSTESGQLLQAVERQRSRVAEAAERLLQQGFLDEADGERCLIVTALDL